MDGWAGGMNAVVVAAEVVDAHRADATD